MWLYQYVLIAAFLCEKNLWCHSVKFHNGTNQLAQVSDSSPLSLPLYLLLPLSVSLSYTCNLTVDGCKQKADVKLSDVIQELGFQMFIMGGWTRPGYSFQWEKPDRWLKGEFKFTLLPTKRAQLSSTALLLKLMRLASWSKHRLQWKNTLCT